MVRRGSTVRVRQRASGVEVRDCVRRFGRDGGRPDEWLGSMRASSGRRRRPRDARGGGACERRGAERHDLRECDRGRGAAHGDVGGARRRRLVPLGAWQRRDGGGADRQRDLRPRAMDRDGDRDRRRWRDGAGERHGALGGGRDAAAGHEPLQRGRQPLRAAAHGAPRAGGGPPRGGPVILYGRGRQVSAALAKADGTFRLSVPRVRARGPYEARTPDAVSAPVRLKVHAVLRATFVGEPTVGGRLALTARISPAAAGRLSIRLYRDGSLIRKARAGAAARLAVATDRIAGYRAVVRVEPVRGWLGAVRIARANVLCSRPAPGSRGAYGDGLVYRYYPGAGYQFQPWLSFAALNNQVLQRRCDAVRRLASALRARAVRSGGAAYWEYQFSFAGGPVPWRSGFAQVVAAQALARAGVMLRDPALSALAAASFRGLRRTLLIALAGGWWIREYGFTGQVILNAQLQSMISLDSYATLAESAAARLLADELAVAAQRLLPSFDLGCWARYELGGAAADPHHPHDPVQLLRRLAASRPEPVWRRTYLRWRRCLPQPPDG